MSHQINLFLKSRIPASFLPKATESPALVTHEGLYRSLSATEAHSDPARSNLSSGFNPSSTVYALSSAYPLASLLARPYSTPLGFLLLSISVPRGQLPKVKK